MDVERASNNQSNALALWLAGCSSSENGLCFEAEPIRRRPAGWWQWPKQVAWKIINVSWKNICYVFRKVSYRWIAIILAIKFGSSFVSAAHYGVQDCKSTTKRTTERAMLAKKKLDKRTNKALCCLNWSLSPGLGRTKEYYMDIKTSSNCLRRPGRAGPESSHDNVLLAREWQASKLNTHLFFFLANLRR